MSSSITTECCARVRGSLPVGDGHVLYWEQYGSPAGMSAVALLDCRVPWVPGAGHDPYHLAMQDAWHATLANAHEARLASEYSYCIEEEARA